MKNTLHNQTTISPVDDRLLAAKDAAKELGICVSLFWRLNKTGDVPPAIYVTAKTPRWRRSELHAALDARRSAGNANSKRGATQ